MANEKAIIENIMSTSERLPQTGSAGSPNEPILNNKDGTGRYLANMRLSLERLARYVELAQLGRFEQLHEELNKNTLDPDRHPSHIILGATMLMAAYYKRSGKSFIPAIRAASREWKDDGPPPGIFN